MGEFRRWFPAFFSLVGFLSWASCSKYTPTEPGPPGAPTLAFPADGSTIADVSVTLRWRKSADASSYGLQVSTSSSFSSTIVNVSGLTDTFRVVSGLSNGTTYYWRVYGSNSGGTGAFSTVWSFKVPPAAPLPPGLAFPADSSSIIDTTQLLRWHRSSTAVSYGLQVSSSSDFSSTVVNEFGLADTFRVVHGLSYGTTYYWRVNATNSGGTGAYSVVWSFRTPPPTPLPPTLVSPGEGATGVSTSPTFVWNRSTGAAAFYYKLQVSKSPTFDSFVVNDDGIVDTTFTVTGLEGSTTYYWRVNATGVSGAGAYSATRSFTTAAGGSGRGEMGLPTGSQGWFRKTEVGGQKSEVRDQTSEVRIDLRAPTSDLSLVQ
jgi:hypothetical protein